MSACNGPEDIEAGASRNNAESDMGRQPLLSPSSHSSSSASSTARAVVFQLPKELFLRQPRGEKRGRTIRKHYRLRRRCSFCRILSLFIGFIFLMSVVFAILYAVYRPQAPSYSIDSISVKNLKLNDLVYASPEFDVTVRVENPNKWVGIFYENGSDVRVLYAGEHLVSGVFPMFYQGRRNATSFRPLVLTGFNVKLSSAAHEALIQGQQDGRVPLVISLNVPLRLEFRSMKTWKFTVEVRCELTVDKLLPDAKIVRKDCKYAIDV